MRPVYFTIMMLGFSAAVAAIAGCTRAGEAASAADEAAIRAETTARSEQLENMRGSGEFAAFVADSVAAADDYPHDARLRALAAEGLFAAGNARAAEADATEAERLASPVDNDISSAAIRLWATARMRQGLPLETAQLARITLDDPALQTVLAWSDLLADTAPFQVEASASDVVEASLSEAAAGSLAAELLAIDGSANGTPCRTIFIDTGAQHTVITRAAAEAAGVRIQPGEIELAGFASATAEAGLIETLQLGSLTIRNVPVLVGDSPALTAAEGSMSLGTDLLYHLRVTLDYPARRVTVEPADARSEAPTATASTEWRIPVWTFSRLPLAQGLSADGSPIRVLIDTGDRSGTYISYRWGRRQIPQLAGVHSGMVFRFKKKDLRLPIIELGGRAIADWPVVDTLPKELDRLDVVDLMLGHDLLERFRVTVDLSRNEFRLSTSDPQAMQSPIRPAAAKGEHDLP
jgi:predicted aspartyl protease